MEATESNKPRQNPMKRRKSRQLALQALYQWQLSGNDIGEIETQYLADNNLNKMDPEYLHCLLVGITTKNEEIDTYLLPVLDRPVGKLDPIERNILRIGVFEFLYRIDIPYKVVINESIELAKRFGASGSHRYINGTLDKLTQKLRALELGS